MNYHPNLIARSLVMKKTRNITLISGTLKNPFFVETTDSIVRMATDNGYNIMVYFENMGINQNLFESIVSNKPDGIILSSILLDDPFFEDLHNLGIPYMMFNRRPRNGGNYVVLDNERAAELVTEYLIELGHERIAFISGHINASTFYERKKGFEQAMRKYLLPIDESLVPITDATEAEVEKATLDLISLQNPPTAIICASDAMALKCMDTLKNQGLRIPADISLCGIDDVGISSHASIGLTTVGPYKFKLGILAIENLIDLMENGMGSSSRQIVLQPKLVVRSTTAHPR